MSAFCVCIYRRVNCLPLCDAQVLQILNKHESFVHRHTHTQETSYFRLQPENSSMEPIIVDQVTILDKVVGVYRHIQ